MQSTAVLQSYALGIDHASHESEETCITLFEIKEGVTTVIDIMNIKTKISGKSPQAIFIDDLDREFNVNGYKVKIGVYKSAADQSLYRALRKQGCNPEEAHTAILLSGSQGIRETHFEPSTPVQMDPLGTWEEPKKQLPFYFNRRRF